MTAKWVPLAERPAWVYRAFDSSGVLLYIGMTTDPQMRVSHWLTSAQRVLAHEWFQSVHSITWQRFPTRTDAKAAEASAIQEERPVINVHHKVRAA